VSAEYLLFLSTGYRALTQASGPLHIASVRTRLEPKGPVRTRPYSPSPDIAAGRSRWRGMFRRPVDDLWNVKHGTVRDACRRLRDKGHSCLQGWVARRASVRFVEGSGESLKYGGSYGEVSCWDSIMRRMFAAEHSVNERHADDFRTYLSIVRSDTRQAVWRGFGARIPSLSINLGSEPLSQWRRHHIHADTEKGDVNGLQ
jgi:hypothetical protein